MASRNNSVATQSGSSKPKGNNSLYGCIGCLGFLVIIGIVVIIILNASDNGSETSNQASTVNENAAEQSVTQPKLGDHLKVFKQKYGKPNSNYMYSYTFKDDGVHIDTEDDYIKEVSMSWAGDNFLTGDQALEEILNFLPPDAKQIATKKITDDHILFAYKSDTIATVFKDSYYETKAIEKGRILIRIIEGDKGSTVRREGETSARMSVGLEHTDEIDLGLISK